MKKKILCACLLISLSGCLGDPNTAVDLMKGNGSVSRAPDGSMTFRYVVHADAYDGIIDDPKELRSQHEMLIGQFLGNAQHCPSGYAITSRSRNETVPAYVYEGRCR
ncbi:hypothetical protein DYI42_12890 [Vannielia litorea]|nr:hypothetical protein [Vannielia litorea]